MMWNRRWAIEPTTIRKTLVSLAVGGALCLVPAYSCAHADDGSTSSSGNSSNGSASETGDVNGRAGANQDTFPTAAGPFPWISPADVVGIPPKYLSAFRALKEARSFRVDWPETERFPDGIWAFADTQFHNMKTLFVSPQADELFKLLLDGANIYGRLYALCGLYFTDRSIYDQSIEALRQALELSLSRDPLCDHRVLTELASHFEGFYGKNGEPPQNPTRLRANIRTAEDEIEIYLARGGDPNGPWIESHTQTLTTPLIFAATRGESKAVQLLLDRGADARPEKNFGMSLLAMYAACGDSQELARLLRNGVSVDVQQDNGYTALHWAVRSGQTDVVEKLLEFGANPNIPTKNGLMPLHLALSRDVSPVVIETLINHGADHRIWNVFGTEAIQWTYSSGNTEMLRRLLKEIPSTPDLPKALADTLHFALKDKDLASIRLLLERGAQLSPKSVADFSDFFGPLPRYTTVQFLILEALIAHGQMPPLDYWTRRLVGGAAIAGRASLVTYLVDHGAQIDLGYPEGQRTLLQVVVQGNLSILEALLKAGRGTASKSEDDRADLYFAAKAMGHSEIAQKFFNPESSREKKPSTLLFLEATRLGNVALIEGLLALGADVNARAPRDKYNRLPPDEPCVTCQSDLMEGDTALHVATAVGSIPAVKALLQHGGDPNAQNTLYGSTPLHYLFELFGEGYLEDHHMREIATLLISQGARPDITNRAGKTPLVMMVERQEVEAVQVLLELGASVTVRDSHRRTPLQVAQLCDSDCQEDPYIGRRRQCVEGLLRDRVPPR